MGFLDLFRRSNAEQRGNPLDNPAVSLTSPAAWAWINSGEPTAAGEVINEQNSLQTITVYACVRVIAESVASLPLKLYESLPNGRQEAVDQDLYNLLTISANPEMTAFSFFETLAGCLALTGNAYAQIQRSGSKIIGLWPLHPLKTAPVRIDGKLMYKTTDGMQNGQYRLVPAEDMIAIPLFSFDGLNGLSPIQLARQNIAMSRATLKFGARLFFARWSPRRCALDEQQPH